MFDPQTQLVSHYLVHCLGELATAGDAEPAATEIWARAAAALGGTRAKEPDLAEAIDAKDADALRAIAEEWGAQERELPEHDVEILRRALKAFTKSLKVTQLDSESTLGGRGMTSGRTSSIVGIVPPPRFPRDVWDELVRRGELRGGRQGIYELPPA